MVGLVVEIAGPAAKADSESAIAARIGSLRPDLLVVARLLVPWQEADDLAQTTLEIALRHVAQVRDPTRLRAWLISIETREAFRLRRRIRRNLVRPFTDDEPESTSRGVTREELIILRLAVQGLPERMRTAVVLHHMARLSVTETATAMGTSENTVKAQLKAGLARLREAMG